MNPKTMTAHQNCDPPASRNWAVIMRLSALVCASGYVLWKLAETWHGNQILLPAIGVSLITLTAFYLVGRWQGRLSVSTILSWAAPWVTLALVFFLSSSAWHARRYEKEFLVREAFEREVHNAQSVLVERIRRYEEFLKLAEPLLETNEKDADRVNDGFVTQLVKTRYPAIAAIGVVDRKAATKRLGQSGPKKDAGKTALPVSNTHSYRFRGLPAASAACGESFDLPDHRFVNEVAARAGDNQTVTIGRKLALDCGSGVQDYLLLLRRVGGTHSGSPRWHASLLLPAQLLAPPRSDREHELDYAVVDGSDETSDTVLYWAGGPVSPGSAWFQQNVPLQVGERIWTLRFRTRDSFEAVFDREGLTSPPWRGLLLSVVVFGLAWSLAHKRRDVIVSKRYRADSETEACIRAVMRHTTDGIIGVDQDGTVRSFNPAAEKLFGYRAGEAIGAAVERLLNLAKPSESVGNEQAWPLFSAANWSNGSEMIARHRDGSEFPAEVRVGETHSGTGRFYTLIVRDVRTRKIEQQQLQRLASFPDHNPQPIVETDLEGKVTYINPEAARRFPDLRELQGGHPILRQFTPAVESFKKGRERPIVQRFQLDRASYEQHVCYVPKGDFIRIYIFDITDRRQALEDPLTGLPNRTLFLERLAQASKAARSGAGYTFAVMFLDMDNFKNINDTYGHLIADQLLKVVARRLDGCLRPRDIVARLGGDEFTILLDNIRDLESMKTVATRIQERLAEPFELACHRFHTTVSIGMATSSMPYQTPSDLLCYADAAMYRAKALGRARSVVFDASVDKAALARLASVELS